MPDAATPARGIQAANVLTSLLRSRKRIWVGRDEDGPEQLRSPPSSATALPVVRKTPALLEAHRLRKDNINIRMSPCLRNSDVTI